FFLRHERDALVNFGKRQLRVNLAERNDRFQTLILFAGKTGSRTPISRDGGGFLLHQEVYLKRGDGQIGVFFLAVVDTARAAREHFDDYRRLVLERIQRRVWTTGHRYVRVIEAILSSDKQANLRVRVIRLAAFAAQTVTQRVVGVAADVIM